MFLLQAVSRWRYGTGQSNKTSYSWTFSKKKFKKMSNKISWSQKLCLLLLHSHLYHVSTSRLCQCQRTCFWTPALAAGSYEFMPVRPCVRPYVRTSVCNALFSELALRIFLKLCMKVGEYKGSKVTESDFSAKLWNSRSGVISAEKC